MDEGLRGGGRVEAGVRELLIAEFREGSWMRLLREMYAIWR